MLTITLNCFGSARTLTGTKLEFPAAITIATIRKALQQQLLNNPQRAELLTVLATCAFASETQVLSEDYLISHDLNLHLLPPVCGG